MRENVIEPCRCVYPDKCFCPTEAKTHLRKNVILFSAPEMEQLPPRVRQAVESIRFALTLKSGDMDGISAVHIARDAGIVAQELQRQIKGRKVRP